MTDNQQSDPIVPEHTVQITHYIRPPGEFGGWSQHTTDQLGFREAIAWLQAKLAEIEGRPVQDASSAQETPAPAPESDAVPPAAEAVSDAPAAVAADGPVTT